MSFRTILVWTALVAALAAGYVVYFDALGVAPRLRLSLGVILVVVGFVTALFGNQFDSALTRQRKATNPHGRHKS